jgi:hypothetical protein
MTRRVSYVLWVIGGLWITAMIALAPDFVALHRKTRDVERVFSDFGTALQSRQFDQAYLLCDSDFRRAMPYDKFVAVQQSLEADHGALKFAKQVGYKVDGKGDPIHWKAVIDADLGYEKKTLRFEFMFHEEDGKWVLYGYQEM